MKREISRLYSPTLNKEMDIVAYGDYGFALLLFPTAAADFSGIRKISDDRNTYTLYRCRQMQDIFY